MKQDLKAQTYSLSQPIGFRDPGRDFPGLRDRVEFCLWSQGVLRVMSLVWLGQGDGPQILRNIQKHYGAGEFRADQKRKDSERPKEIFLRYDREGRKSQTTRGTTAQEGEKVERT